MIDVSMPQIVEESVEQDPVESCQPADKECSQERTVDQCSSNPSPQIEVHIAVASQPVLQEHSRARFVEHLMEIPVSQSTMQPAPQDRVHEFVVEKLPEIHVPQNKVIAKMVRPMPQDRNHERLAKTDCGVPANLPQLVPQDRIRGRTMEQGQTPNFANATGHGQLAEASQQVVVPMPQAREEIPSSTRAQLELLKVCRIDSPENYRQAVQKLHLGSNSYCTYFKSFAPLLHQECA